VNMRSGSCCVASIMTQVRSSRRRPPDHGARSPRC
jgi:hypothetical protein